MSEPNNRDNAEKRAELRKWSAAVARAAGSKTPDSESINAKFAVATVTDPEIEISLAEAREMAGDEVEVGDVIHLPIAELPDSSE